MNNRKQGNEENSEDMIDIRIEESLVRESLMKIDASSLKDDVPLLFLFFGIISLSFIVGCTNLQEHIKESENYPLSTNTIIIYQKTELSSKNKFFSLFLCLNRKDTDGSAELRANISFDARCYSRKTLIHSSTQQYDNFLFKSQDDDMTTLPFNFYQDQIIDYERIYITFRIISSEESEFENATITVYYGDKFLNVIELTIKTTFSILEAFLLVHIILQLKSEPIRYWHLEQKLTIPLIFVSIFYNNPFEIIQIISPSYSFLIFDCIVKSIFSSYFELFILALFDSLRYKNRRIKKCFFTPKIIFILILFSVSISHRIYDTITSFDASPILEHDSVETAFRIVEIILYIFYYIWFISSVFRAALQVDVTERYKFNIYFATCFASLVFLSLAYCLNLFEFFKNKTLEIFVPLSTINLFVILMMCFHYPYEVLDGSYDVTHTPQQQNNKNGEKDQQQNQNVLLDSISQIESND